MNNERRKELKKATELCEEAQNKLQEAKEIVECCREEEEECYDNLPESLQDGEKGSLMQDAMDNMGEFIDGCDDVINEIDGLYGYLESAGE